MKVSRTHPQRGRNKHVARHHTRELRRVLDQLAWLKVAMFNALEREALRKPLDVQLDRIASLNGAEAQVLQALVQELADHVGFEVDVEMEVLKGLAEAEAELATDQAIFAARTGSPA